MKQKILSLAVALVLFVCYGMAQQNSSQVYAISYIEEHHLMQRMNQLTVMNVKLEWPDRLCGSDVPTLKKELCRLLFDNESISYRHCIDDMIAKCGKELETMPTSNGMKTTYISFQILEVAYQPDKFISFEVIKSVRHEDNLKASIYNDYLLTYDFLKDKVLRTKDILRPEYQKSGYAQHDFLKNTLNLDVFDLILITNMPDEVCLAPDGLVLNIPGTSSDEDGETLVFIPQNDVNFYCRKNIVRWLKDSRVKSRKDNIENSVVVPILQVGEVDTTVVYDAASTMPTYEGGTSDMMKDLVKWVEYPQYEMSKNIQGKVVVSFVVGRDGRVSSPVVLTPISPGIDRAAVKAVMALSKWSPGAFGDTKVNVKMAVPVVFKMSKD